MKHLLPTFLQTESPGGLLLILSTILALAAANSPLASTYTTLLNFPLFHHSLTHWVNDTLMALFFLLVGLEIKRELISGQLSTWPQRLLPGVAALGGMLVPAAIYLLINRHSSATLSGWAIPTATDIAFALGILALIPRVPVSLKIFLTALAILDDLGAILLIAIFYTSGLAWLPLAGAALTFGGLLLLNKLKTSSLTPYLILGACLWVFIYNSGLHPTLAGVLLALTIPLTPKKHSLLLHLEHALAPLVAFIVLPVFGFFNAGISFTGITPAAILHPVTLGIFAGLLLGKQIGIGVAMWASIKFLKAPKPAHATTLQLYAVTLLCGIGFTMSLFIGNLALPESLAPQIRLGILAASLVAALSAIGILALTPRKS